MKLTYAEESELRYLLLKGFKWLVRNEIGSVNVFKNKPHRDKETNYAPFGKTRGGYDAWIETKTPISWEEQQRKRSVELGEYNFIKWSDEPMLIEELVKEKQCGLFLKSRHPYNFRHGEETPRVLDIVYCKLENKESRPCFEVQYLSDKLIDHIPLIAVAGKEWDLFKIGEGVPITTWEELSKCKSETHYLKIDLDIGCGWVISKTNSESRFYLSTHSFYASSYQHTTKILQDCGFNVKINNWG